MVKVGDTVCITGCEMFCNRSFGRTGEVLSVSQSAYGGRGRAAVKFGIRDEDYGYLDEVEVLSPPSVGESPLLPIGFRKGNYFFLLASDKATVRVTVHKPGTDEGSPENYQSIELPIGSLTDLGSILPEVAKGLEGAAQC